MSSFVYVMTQIWHYDPWLNTKTVFQKNCAEYKGRVTADNTLELKTRKDNTHIQNSDMTWCNGSLPVQTLQNLLCHSILSPEAPGQIQRECHSWLAKPAERAVFKGKLPSTSPSRRHQPLYQPQDPMFESQCCSPPLSTSTANNLLIQALRTHILYSYSYLTSHNA